MERTDKKRIIGTTIGACIAALVVLYGGCAAAQRMNRLVLSWSQCSWGAAVGQLLWNAGILLLPPVVFLRLTHTKPGAVGFTGRSKGLVLGLGGVYLLLFVRNGAFSAGGVGRWLHLLICIALAEELMYRGFVYTRLKQVNPWLALVVSGGFWGAGHAVLAGVLAGRPLPELLLTMVVGGEGVSVTVLGGIVAGIGFAALYEWSGTLFVPVFLHAILDYCGSGQNWVGFGITAVVAVFLGVKRTRVEHKPLAFWRADEMASPATEER